MHLTPPNTTCKCNCFVRQTVHKMATQSLHKTMHGAPIPGALEPINRVVVVPTYCC